MITLFTVILTILVDIIFMGVFIIKMYNYDKRFWYNNFIDAYMLIVSILK